MSLLRTMVCHILSAWSAEIFFIACSKMFNNLLLTLFQTTLFVGQFLVRGADISLVCVSNSLVGSLPSGWHENRAVDLSHGVCDLSLLCKCARFVWNAWKCTHVYARMCLHASFKADTRHHPLQLLYLCSISGNHTRLIWGKAIVLKTIRSHTRVQLSMLRVLMFLQTAVCLSPHLFGLIGAPKAIFSVCWSLFIQNILCAWQPWRLDLDKSQSQANRDNLTLSLSLSRCCYSLPQFFFSPDNFYSNKECLRSSTANLYLLSPIVVNDFHHAAK